MSDSPAASVIVLGYNGRRFLPACLDSVLDQSFPADQYEVIYADNASQDGSVEFVSQNYSAVRVIRFPRNLGFAEGNNQAAEVAQGRYLLFLNQDTVCHRHWLAEMVRAMQYDPLVKAGHAAGSPLKQSYLERERPVERGYLCDVSRYGTVQPVEVALDGQPIPTLHCGGGAMILERAVAAELGVIFDPRFMAYGEDLDLGLRLNGLGYKVVFVPAAVCYHDREGRAEPSRQTLRRAALATRNRFLAYMKNMYADEFLLSLPLLWWGSQAKMQGLVGSPIRRIIYGLGLIPFTTYHLLRAVELWPVYAADRRRILAERARHYGRYWLLREMWGRER